MVKNATPGSKSGVRVATSGAGGSGKVSKTREKRSVGRPMREKTKRCVVEITDEESGNKTTAMLGGGGWQGFKAGIRAAAIDAIAC